MITRLAILLLANFAIAEPLSNSLGMKLQLIPAGNFAMGLPEG